MTKFDYLTSHDKWVLSDISGEDTINVLFADELPFLKFDDGGQLFGFSGCNNFHGNYSITDAGIEIEPGAMTRKMCPGNGENVFIQALNQIRTFEVDEAKLILKADNNVWLSFVPE
jgi:heat shock protein HslJ